MLRYFCFDFRITNLKLDTLETACENKDSVSVEKLAQSIVVNEMFGDSAFNFKVMLLHFILTRGIINCIRN